MKEQFVTYEIAFALKELGFDERCLGHFDIQSKVLYVGDTEMNVSVLSEILLPAPLWQQVIDWFREKHKIDIYPEPTYSLTEYSFKVITVHGKSKKQEYWDGMGKTYNTYQEAREAAILEAIKIVKGEK